MRRRELLLASAAWAAGNVRAAAREERDVPYGDDPRQRYDVYIPAQPTGPVILMVHGGGWRFGDKGSRDVVENKAAHWLPKGYVFVSANNRLLPTDPMQQARDVARALASVQAKAASWGADPQRVVLMGHSAGAHLVALVTASPALAREAGVQPWRGTVALDSAAMDAEEIMQARHVRLYDNAFGSDPAYWRSVSPLQAVQAGGPPLLAVCSSRRATSCGAARRFAQKANGLGLRTTVLPQDLSHMEINRDLGLPGDYTDAVDRWIAALV